MTVEHLYSNVLNLGDLCAPYDIGAMSYGIAYNQC